MVDKSEHTRRSLPGRVRMALLSVAGVTAAAGAVMVIGANGATATPDAAPSGSASGGGNSNNISFCHRTDSNTNPYVEITTDPNSIIKRGHGDHTGPIWDPTLKAQHIKWGDIIPPFEYTDKKGTHSFPGLNWTEEGQAILANGCQIPSSESSGSSSSSSSGSSSSSSSSNGASGASSSHGQSAGSSATTSPAPIPSGVSAGLHTPLTNAGLQAWGIVLLVLGGLSGLLVGLWPTRRRVH